MRSRSSTPVPSIDMSEKQEKTLFERIMSVLDTLVEIMTDIFILWK